MHGPIREVDMEARYVAGECRVVVITPGKYFGHYVNCSKDLRERHEKFRGYVAGNTKSDATQAFAILVDRRGGRSIDGFTRMGTREDVWPPVSDLDLPLIFRDEPQSFHGLALEVYDDLRYQKTLSEIRQRLSWKIRISGWHFVIEEEGFKYRFKLIDNTFIKDRLHNKRIGTHYFEVKVDIKKTSSGYKAFSTVKSVSKSDFESSISYDWQDAFITYISYCKAQLASNHKLNGKRRQFMKLIDEMGGENTLPSMMFLS